jgi:plasmid stabilization system protein ParE
MSEIEFHPAARAELVAVSVYLESERAGYGSKFADEVDSLCERIMRHPKSGSPLEGWPSELDVRAYRLPTFRYSLIVVAIDGRPTVYAVAHHHRAPGYWRQRLK